MKKNLMRVEIKNSHFISIHIFKKIIQQSIAWSTDSLSRAENIGEVEVRGAVIVIGEDKEVKVIVIEDEIGGVVIAIKAVIYLRTFLFALREIFDSKNNPIALNYIADKLIDRIIYIVIVKY